MLFIWKSKGIININNMNKSPNNPSWVSQTRKIPNLIFVDAEI